MARSLANSAILAINDDLAAIWWRSGTRHVRRDSVRFRSHFPCIDTTEAIDRWLSGTYVCHRSSGARTARLIKAGKRKPAESRRTAM